MMRHCNLLAGAAFSLGAFAIAVPALAADVVPSYVEQAVKDRGRPAWDIDRDANRKPAQVLAFSRIVPGDVVGELVPGKGYYTRILAKLVGPQGKVYSVVPFTGQLGAESQGPKPVDDVLAIQNIAEYSNVTVLWERLNPFGGQFSVPEQLDAVWTSDNYHDMHNPGMKIADEMPGFLKAVFGSLKPGGIFLVFDHAAAKGAGFSVTGTLHRAEPDAVKAEVMAAGFTLDGESNVLANPADDHTKKVFEMHDKTDQFIFRFRKPMNASNTDMRPPRDAMAGYFGNTSISNKGIEDKIPRQERRVFYNADGTYQEFGRVMPGRPAPMQAGLWYWDAAGHNCMIHQYPAFQRQLIVCHVVGTYKNVGDTWMQGNTPYELVEGHVPLE